MSSPRKRAAIRKAEQAVDAAKLETGGERFNNVLLKAKLFAAKQRISELTEQRDELQRRYDSAVRLLTGIHALLYPAPIEMPDGRTMVFRPKNPDQHIVLQELSDRIRALPDELEAIAKAEKK